MKRNTLLYAGAILGGILGVLVVGFAILSVASMSHDRSNPRSRPNAYYSELTVAVDRPVDEAYAYVKYGIPDIYTEMSAMHEKFEILNANGLIEGAEIDCIEGETNQRVRSHYVVTEAIENELIQMESVPSVVTDRETGRKIGESNTYLYFDFEPLDDGRTQIRQTIVLDMRSPMFKSLSDVMGVLTGSRTVWDDHFREELEKLAAHIDQA